jgi:hypothetical protein
MALLLGFEPRLADYETAVLPLILQQQLIIQALYHKERGMSSEKWCLDVESNHNHRAYETQEITIFRGKDWSG